MVRVRCIDDPCAMSRYCRLRSQTRTAIHDSYKRTRGRFHSRPLSITLIAVLEIGPVLVFSFFVDFIRGDPYGFDPLFESCSFPL